MSGFGEVERLLETTLRGRHAARLAEALGRGSWIYGAGQYGQKIGALLQAGGYPICGFIDRRAGPGFQDLLDARVIHPDAFAADMAQNRTFVSAVVNSQPASDEVAPWAERWPFADILKGADLPDVLGPQADTFWLSSRRTLVDNLHRLRPLAARLADVASEDAFLGALKFRITGETRWLPVVGEQDQYIPPDLPGFNGPITFVDGGAYNGDSCAALIAHGVTIDRYVGFEPDADNFARLQAYLKDVAFESEGFPYGLSDHAHEVSFADGQGVCSHISDGPGATKIQCIALDDLLPDLAADYIKLDIEGAELAALNGMVRSVERYRPRLAVCLYHKPQDIWEIPAWIGERYDQFYVRQHGGFGFDTVLYTLP